MSLHELRAGTYGFDDLNVGDWFSTHSAEVSTAAIDAFAVLSGDHFEIHMDEDAAHRHGFSSRVAHGLLVLSVVDGLKNRADVKLKAQASLGWDWSFKAPVLAGDQVSARLEVAEKVVVSDQRRGILTLDLTVTNQHRNTVQTGCNRLMVYR